MPTSEARIQANRKNAAHSTGPKTEEGKERSRQNSLKHGLTGAGVVLIEADAAEVERRTLTFTDELMVIGDIGQALVRRAALNSVRMERGADQQAASLTQRVRQVEADFVAPEGVTEAEAAQLRTEAVRIAMFDPSKEATLARQYEAAAERGFYRALKQLRQMELQYEALLKDNDAKLHNERMGSFKDDDTKLHNEMMGSFYESRQAAQKSEDEVEAIYTLLNLPRPREPLRSAQSTATSREVDVPITIGRPR